MAFDAVVVAKAKRLRCQIDSGDRALGQMENFAKRIIAHRGLWKAHERQVAKKNSREAFEFARMAGFGIELDIRDSLGELVVSHDPAESEAPRFELQSFEGLNGPLAINIKSDGLAPSLLDQLSRAAVSEVFFFDFSIPEMVRYEKLGLPTCQRLSDLGESPRGSFDWIWVDSFESNWNIEICEEIASMYPSGRLIFVSPELHGRIFGQRDMIRFRDLFLSRSNVYLCTDTPVEFLEFLAGETIHD